MHKGFTSLLGELDYCNLYTSNNSIHNPPCLAILGETGAGKTTLVHQWLARNNNTRSETPQGSIIPYLYVSVPAKASIKGTAAAFLTTLDDPNLGRGTQWNMVTHLHTLLKSCQVHMIFVDEFQHILDHETQQVLNAVTDFLKDIINQSSIPMILIGQTGEAEPILRTNPQLSRRVGTPRYMHPFPWDRSHPKTIIDVLWKAVCSETGPYSLGRVQRRRTGKYLAGALLHSGRGGGSTYHIGNALAAYFIQSKQQIVWATALFLVLTHPNQVLQDELLTRIVYERLFIEITNSITQAFEYAWWEVKTQRALLLSSTKAEAEPHLCLVRHWHIQNAHV